MYFHISSKHSSLSLQFFLFTGLLLFISTGFCAETTYTDSTLFNTYQRLKPELDKNTYGVPIYIESSDKNNRMQGEIYGELDIPFHDLHDKLLIPKNWCDIAPLHLNIKVCTYQVSNNKCLLTFYTGRKFYEPPEDTFQLSYVFKVSKKTQQHFQIELTAKDGPMGTSQYRISMEAIPVNKTSSFIHFTYSYKYNAITSLGMNTYLSTIGSDKVGFSITGKSDDGKPVYIGGKLGIIERNAVRYYLAIKSYLVNRNLSENEQFSARLQRWFDLTENHHLQLHEVEKQDYLRDKEKEMNDQKLIQDNLNSKSNMDACL